MAFRPSCELNRDVGNASLMYKLVDYWLESYSVSSDLTARPLRNAMDLSRPPWVLYNNRPCDLTPTSFQLGEARKQFPLLGYIKSIFCSLAWRYWHRACSSPLPTFYYFFLSFPTLVLDFPFPCRFLFFPSLTHHMQWLRQSAGFLRMNTSVFE